MGNMHALVARQHRGANTCCSVESLLASGSINTASLLTTGDVTVANLTQWRVNPSNASNATQLCAANSFGIEAQDYTVLPLAPLTIVAHKDPALLFFKAIIVGSINFSTVIQNISILMCSSQLEQSTQVIC